MEAAKRTCPEGRTESVCNSLEHQVRNGVDGNAEISTPRGENEGGSSAAQEDDQP